MLVEYLHEMHPCLVVLNVHFTVDIGIVKVLLFAGS